MQEFWPAEGSRDLPLTVTQINAYIKDLLDNDEQLRSLWLEGEVSNFTRAASGHLYFTLKDAESAIKCVMWRTAADRLGYRPAREIRQRRLPGPGGGRRAVRPAGA